jgi:hypothetical protein
MEDSKIPCLQVDLIPFLQHMVLRSKLMVVYPD